MKISSTDGRKHPSIGQEIPTTNTSTTPSSCSDTCQAAFKTMILRLPFQDLESSYYLLLPSTHSPVFDSIYASKASTLPLGTFARTVSTQEFRLFLVAVVQSIRKNHVTGERRGRKRHDVAHTTIGISETFIKTWFAIFHWTVLHLDRIAAFHTGTWRILSGCVLAVAGELDEWVSMFLQVVF